MKTLAKHFDLAVGP